MTFSTSDYYTLLYKIFIIFLIISQAYAVIFQVVNMFTIIANSIMGIYLIFRFYLLVNLKKRAREMSLTLPQFLNMRDNKCEACEKCEHKS